MEEAVEEADGGPVVEDDADGVVVADGLEVEPLGFEELAEARDVDLVVDPGELVEGLGGGPCAGGLGWGPDARHVDDLIDLHLCMESLVSLCARRHGLNGRWRCDFGCG